MTTFGVLNMDEIHSMTVDQTQSHAEICLVCGSLAKGLHFQVNSCRACAAFYRRSIKSKLVYRCQRGTGQCDLKLRIKGKPMCRYCRMKKCADIGMRIDIDIGHESTASPEVSDCATNDDFGGFVFRDDSIKVEGNRIIYNVQPLIAHIKDAIVKNNVYYIKGLSGVTLSPLQRMVHEVSKFVASRAPKPSDVQVVAEVGAETCMRFQEEYLLKLVQMLTSCEYFVKLEDDQKFPIFRHFWGSFQQVERAYQTIALFGYDTNDFRILFENKRAIDIGTTKFIIGDVDGEKVKSLFTPVKNRVFACLMNPMRTLRPTMFELSYITINLLWTCFDLDCITPASRTLAEEVLERSANELHNYYVYEMRLINYAARHAALMRITSAIDSIIRSKKDVMILMRLFNVLENDFFDSELTE